MSGPAGVTALVLAETVAGGLVLLFLTPLWGEVKRGKVDHAIRFTTDITDNRYVWPARHRAGAVQSGA